MASQALKDHTKLLYRAMEELSNVDVSDPDARIYKGRITKLYLELGISSSFYTRIRRALEVSGCIEIQSVGAGGYPSIIKLIREPVDEDFLTEDLTGRRHLATLVSDLEAEVAVLRAWRLSATGEGQLNISEALRNHERRILDLEALTVKESNAKAKKQTQN